MALLVTGFTPPEGPRPSRSIYASERACQMPRKSGVPSESRGGEKGEAALCPAARGAAMQRANAAAAAIKIEVATRLFMLARCIAFRASVVIHIAFAFVAIVVDDLILG